MQNKGAISFLAIALALVCVYQLSFTAASYKVKKEAREYAAGDLVKEVNYLDSIASLPKEKWSFLGQTYKDVQTKELNLGLDLKGGMNVILEISVEDIVRALSNYSTDKTFNEAIKLAKEKQKSGNEDFISLFVRSFEEVDPNGRLAAIFGTVELKDRINFNSSNQDVQKVLEEEANIAIDNSFNILRNRIDHFGVIQPDISHLQPRSRILVALPGVKDPERVRKLLQGTANLEFWETYNNSEILPYLIEANEYLRSIQKEVTAVVADTVKETQATEEQTLLDKVSQDTLSQKEDASFEEFARQNPLFGVLYPNLDRQQQPYPGSVIGHSSPKDTAKVMEYLRMNQVRSIFPREVRFKWSQNTSEMYTAGTMYELHAIKVTTRDGRAPLTGDVVTSARPTTGVTGAQIKVDMSMNAEGAKKWQRITRENVGRYVVVVLDGFVRSSARVQGEIPGGNTEITGDYTFEEAEDLANVLKSGKMPAPAHIIQDTVVGPSLGKAAISDGMNSFIIAFIIVLLYMIFYYSRSAGTVADIAMVVNLFFMMGVLVSLNAVLTLPGIAGIILTIGMSVDANVLIFERIKEETRAGKGVKLAVADGYKGASSAIIDSNLTTLVTGVILYFFGTGPIKGFATTLVIGIVTSLFSAVLITRLIYEWALKRNLHLKFSAKYTENFLENMHIDFVKLRKYGYIFSITLTLLSIVALSTKGLNKGIDFTGGRTYVVNFQKSVSTQEVAALLTDELGSTPVVVTYGADEQVKISTKYKIEDPAATDEVNDLLYAGLKELLPGVDRDTFVNEYIVSSETVGPTIADDIKVKAVYAVVLALIGMFMYILLRFRKWQYGLGSVVALAHDVIIVLGLYSILQGIMPFSMDIDQSFIAAILTVVGYSLNDTVVIFDRIREYLPMYRKRSTKEVYNLALNSTLARTLNTGMATIFVLIVIFIFGGEVIRGFVFALLFGIVFGTYSSVFISTPILYETTRKNRIEGGEVQTTGKKK